MFKRVLIVGCPGSGKSTLARQLYSKWNLELVHLDSIYHDTKLWSDETAQKNKQWRKYVELLSKKDNWMMDGNYTSTLDIRIPRADTVIFLDYPRYVSLIRTVKRRFVYSKKPRPDMPSDWTEKLNPALFKKIWNFKYTHKPRIKRLIEDSTGKTIVVLRSPNETRKYLLNI